MEKSDEVQSCVICGGASLGYPALLGNAPMSAEDLAEDLETTQATVRTKLNTYKETFIKLGEKWALKSHQQR